MKKLQSGRSMIEMLGVLAIIGVLSIGGLAAYNTAMERQRVNDLIYDASLCLAEAATLTDAQVGENGIDCNGQLDGIAAGRVTITGAGVDATVEMQGADAAAACERLADRPNAADYTCGAAG